VALIEELEGVLASLGRTFEVVCVDDRSTDKSLDVLASLGKARPYLRVVRHGVNCGESAAQASGFRSALGAIIITMDADLQNDPADIPRLLENLDAGTAAVCGVRGKREDSPVRRLSSRVANAFRNAVTGDRITDAGCTFRAIRSSALGELPVFNGLHRFLPTILRFQGFKVKELKVNHRPRTRGVSKYGVGNRMWRGIRDCLAMRWYRARRLPADRIIRDD
jgi:glycosyltransferase involved in cell wall biosynthesis